MTLPICDGYLQVRLSTSREFCDPTTLVHHWGRRQQKYCFRTFSCKNFNVAPISVFWSSINRSFKVPQKSIGKIKGKSSPVIGCISFIHRDPHFHLFLVPVWNFSQQAGDKNQFVAGKKKTIDSNRFFNKVIYLVLSAWFSSTHRFHKIP